MQKKWAGKKQKMEVIVTTLLNSKMTIKEEFTFKK